MNVVPKIQGLVMLGKVYCRDSPPHPLTHWTHLPPSYEGMPGSNDERRCSPMTYPASETGIGYARHYLAVIPTIKSFSKVLRPKG